MITDKFALIISLLIKYLILNTKNSLMIYIIASRFYFENVLRILGMMIVWKHVHSIYNALKMDLIDLIVEYLKSSSIW